MKFPCEISKIKANLQFLGAKYLRTEEATDYYFQHPNRNFSKTDEALRMRKTENYTELTYKGPKLTTKSKSRLELTAQLMDDKIIDILKELGFNQTGLVGKKREMWELDDVTISLDEVENLGEFVELEIILDSKDEIAQIELKLCKMSKRIGIKQAQIRTSYLQLLQSKRS
ncbi:MAG: class IV adenylate cyclase [Candidatus Heimdallarchaeota archaeon]|nr:class IV adenylate cyclase [Candidatus Heimdallarchaeota archaeon]